MSARTLLVLTTGAALLIAGCSSGVGGSAAPAPSAIPTAPATSSAPPSSSAQTQAPTPTPAATQTSSTQSGSEKSTAGAIARYETFLHAVGKEDLATTCEIAAPAAKKAEDEGFGPCEKTFPITFQMISAAQKTALRSATVDRARVIESSSTKVEIPAAAVKAAVKFTDSDLGDSTLEYRSGQWYITD
ncbi:hypothetical protein VSH64_35575 [Amycolatopsis rhabdoformis]|uniref:Nuclear transport factor 2 family protein n=1 Tax=Amycolatopsis rhabdoformis TaxID=1448059 RepID=A0ABZ1I3T9_9PSEU|nr:hypothetical protein [Amycolatopsis rhabdoformis]WSE28129.1 hypothetical protein VSH64_35575 [Amycolatopsis rhabdoformis]